MGCGTRKYDSIPYRAVGPVTIEEYESRKEHYDKQLRERINVTPTGKTVKEKIAILRKYREGEYEKLKDAVYKRRDWSQNGVPKLKRVKELAIDFPDIVEILTKN